MKALYSPISGRKCIGCGLCAVSCHSNAIEMRPNQEGFMYPAIDQNRCNGCKRCYEMCTALNVSTLKEQRCAPQKVFACQTKDERWLNEATAGGFFPTLGQWVIEQGGVVFGAAYDEQMRVVHTIAHSIDDLLRFCGSKYVQSDSSLIYDQVRTYLRQGKMVLFSGTPCQVEALRSACTTAERTNLLTVDVLCYGVPSPGLFRAYLNKVEKKHKAKVVDFRFRDKHQNGWSHTTVITLKDNSGKSTQVIEKDYRRIPYYDMFGSRACFRPSCYLGCSYNTIERTGDFTTGNFWAIDSVSQSFDSRMGVSMVLVNTSKAEKVFDFIADRMQVEEHTIEEAIQKNDALVQGSAYPGQRDALFGCFERFGFSATYFFFYMRTIVRNAVLTMRDRYIRK